jgi:D-alanine transaminase
VTRGDGRDRDFVPAKGMKPSVVLFTQEANLLDKPALKTGARVLSLEDLRWKRRDIKTVCLLPQALAKEIAKNAGCDEAWMIEDGYVTEGASSTAYIVTQDDVVVARPEQQFDTAWLHAAFTSAIDRRDRHEAGRAPLHHR